MDKEAAPLFNIFFIIVIAVAVFVVAAIAAMVLVGIVSIFLVKSQTPLVVEKRASVAFVNSMGWASVVTVGCIIGSLGLLALWVARAPGGFELFSNKYGVAYDFMGYMLVVESWLLGDSYSFFVKSTLALFLANRIAVAKADGGHAWLGVIPPIFAGLLFFAFDHWDLISSWFRTFDEHVASQIVAKLVEIVRLPFDLAVRSINDPEYISKWAAVKFAAADGSFFKLAALYPSMFVVIAAAVLLRSVVGPPADVDLG